MPWITDPRLQFVINSLLAVLIALGLWYLVIGSEQVDAQVEIRLEYRGLPEGLVVRDGLVNKVMVRLRGSGELLRNLYSRELTHAVDLSQVKRGANALPLEFERLPELKAFEVTETAPSHLMLEVESIAEKTVPVVVQIAPLPDDSPYKLNYFLADPDVVTVRGPESLIKELTTIPVPYAPGNDPAEGNRSINLALVTPDQITAIPAVTTLHYTLELKTQRLELKRAVQLDANDRSLYEVRPGHILVKVEVPENKVDDAAYLAAIRVLIRPPASLGPGASEELAPLVILPSGARLAAEVGDSPQMVTITRKPDARLPETGATSNEDEAEERPGT